MPAKKYHVNLTEEERNCLQALLKGGQAKARKIARAHILLLADEGVVLSQAGGGVRREEGGRVGLVCRAARPAPAPGLRGRAALSVGGRGAPPAARGPGPGRPLRL